MDTLIRAVDQITDPAIHFIIAGGDPKSIQRTAGLINSCSNSNQISMIKCLPQVELRQLLQSADLGVIPNLDDRISLYSCPLKLFEYLAVGLPIVLSDVLKGHKILLENENCLFFKPGDSFDLAKKIELLLSNRDHCDAISKNNMQKAPQFSYTNRASIITQAIEGIKLDW